jgi:hypothetical protein
MRYRGADQHRTFRMLFEKDPKNTLFKSVITNSYLEKKSPNTAIGQNLYTPIFGSVEFFNTSYFVQRFDLNVTVKRKSFCVLIIKI